MRTLANPLDFKRVRLVIEGASRTLEAIDERNIRIRDHVNEELRMPEVQKFYRPREAAKLLGCGLTRLYEILGRGDLDALKDGRSTLIPASSIAAYQARLLPAAVGQKRQHVG